MIRSLHTAWPLLAAALFSAAGAALPEDLVRQGNAALARGDYSRALEALEAAEERTTDPGLVAFNKAVALYHQGDPARAELSFRLSLENAPAPRRARAMYNLAVCLVQEAGDRDARKLEEAVGLLERYLREAESGIVPAAHVRHNLELAKHLWVEARARPPQKNDTSPEDDRSPRPPAEETKHGLTSSDPGAARGSGEKTRVPAEPGRDPLGTDQLPAPGTGNLAAIPDAAQLAPMSPEDAARHLQQATERVLNERRAYRQRTLRPPSGTVRDW
jgi:tetratricopeptide (TPR) repeat protein